MVDRDTPFYNKEELIAFMSGTITANWDVPLEISSAFFGDLVERMCELDPSAIDEEGEFAQSSSNPRGRAIVKIMNIDPFIRSKKCGVNHNILVISRLRDS